LSTGVSWAVTFVRQLTYDPVWSPRGDWIAYVSQEFGNDDIFTVSPQGSDKERLTFNDWEWDKHPTYSPDGSQIVFWSNRVTGRRQLWIMNADGSEQRVLLESPHNDWDPVWIK
jgi:TolB protein